MTQVRQEQAQVEWSVIQRDSIQGPYTQEVALYITFSLKVRFYKTLQKK